MKIPKQFYIKGKLWKTSRKKNLTNDDGELCTGLTDPDEKHIALDKSLEGPELEWVFWHEYGHALLEEAGVTRNTGGLSDLAEEIVCDTFADAMTLDKTVRFKRGKK